MNRFYRLLTLAFLLLTVPLFAQEDEESMLDLLGPEEPVTNYASASFKTTRIINSHSIENTAKGVLDFKISHRFGQLNGGPYELFGLDQASIRLGFDYGLTDWLMIGVGRSSFEKTYDGFAKARILRQSSGEKNMPITLSFLSAMSVNSLRWADPERENFFSSRLFYTFQMIIGRKFNENFSLQLMPTVVHRNLVATAAEAHDVIAFGIGARQKLTKRVAINIDYYYVLPDQLDPRYRNSLSIGFDIETGGHVFQLHFTNSTGMVEKSFITESTGNWLDGGIHFGFNVSRVFTVRRK